MVDHGRGPGGGNLLTPESIFARFRELWTQPGVRACAGRALVTLSLACLAAPGIVAQEAAAQPEPSADRAAEDAEILALREAARAGDVDRVLSLIEAGMEAEFALPPAAEAGQIEVLRAVTERMPSLDGQVPARAVLQAVRAGRQDAVDFLRAAGASLDGKDVLGRTLLMRAARRGNLSGLRQLVQAGADLEAVTRTGRTALMIAVERGERRGSDILLEAGANPNAADRDGWTPLMMALRKGDRRQVIGLLEAGADPNHVSALGWTPLLLVARDGAVPLFELLARAGADPELSTGAAHSPLIQAVIGHRMAVAKGLLGLGADPSRQVGGRTAIDWARLVGRRGVIELLVAEQRKREKRAAR